MKNAISRRQFLTRSTLAGSAVLGFTIIPSWGKISPNEKLNIGIIGVAGRGGDNLRGVSAENIVALCDIDDTRLAAASLIHPNAKKFNDFKLMLEEKDLDAVVVSTPDHTHAVAAAAAMRSGRHVYCEKPLARTVSEVRALTELARKQNCITQMGIQIHSERNYRRVVEVIQSGAIGSIEEVHVWASASYGGKELPKETPPVPPNIHYNLWLGPVEERPYSPEYVPFAWRNWWAFGGGSLGDFGCHFMDLPFWALDLKYPTAVEPVDGPAVDKETTPKWLIVRYAFPKRDTRPPVKLTWYHGGKYPSELVSPELYKDFKGGVLFVGSKGKLLSSYHQYRLMPEDSFKDFQPPAPTIPNSIGHHKEWIQAIKTGGKASCHFDYAGPLSEAALLGNVAFRVGQKLEWDAASLKATNCPKADEYIQHRYRKGWTL